MNYFLSKNNYIFFIFAKRIEKKPYYNKRKHQMFYVIIQVLLTIQQIINTKTYKFITQNSLNITQILLKIY